jgi:hypothetical protein
LRGSFSLYRMSGRRPKVLCWDTSEEEPEDQPSHRHFPDPPLRAVRPAAGAPLLLRLRVRRHGRGRELQDRSVILY